MPPIDPDAIEEHLPQITYETGLFMIDYLRRINREFENDLTSAIVLGEIAQHSVRDLMKRDFPRSGLSSAAFATRETIAAGLKRCNALSVAESPGLPPECIRSGPEPSSSSSPWLHLLPRRRLSGSGRGPPLRCPGSRWTSWCRCVWTPASDWPPNAWPPTWPSAGPAFPELAALPALERTAGNAGRAPEVDAARAMRVEAEANLFLARRMYLPMVMVDALYQQNLDGMPDGLGFGVTVSVPLWWRDRQTNEVAMAQAMTRADNR